MGNAQSAGPHNRLSKPKTNTNSPFATPIIESPVSDSSNFADITLHERRQLKAQLTASVEGDLESTSTASSSSDGKDGLAELATNIQRRLSQLSRSTSMSSKVNSRHNSITTITNVAGSKLSLVSNSQKIDIDTAVRLLQEVQKNASPEDLAALQQALRTTPSLSSINTDQNVSARGSSIGRSTSSLIRRRSLLVTPGLATRTSPSNGVRRTWNSWITPQEEPQYNPKWKENMMGASPLTRIAALDLAEDGRNSPTPRACTPGDMDYSHLGSMQLGSLVVTNGAASPAASARQLTRCRSSSDLSVQDDYFTASEGHSSPVRRTHRGNPGHSRGKSSDLSRPPLSHRQTPTPVQSRKAKTMSRCDSPLKIGMGAECDENETNPMAESMKSRLQPRIQSADTLAKDYMAELPTSPYAKRTFGHCEGQQEDFSDALSDAASFREEAFRILDGTMFNGVDGQLETAKPAPQSNPVVVARSRNHERSGPRKADSGYSSGGSFRTVRHEVQAGTGFTPSMKPPTAADAVKGGYGSDSDDTGSLYTFEQMLTLPIKRKPLPPIPNHKEENRPATLQIPIPYSHDVAPESAPISPRTIRSMATQGTTESTMSQNRLQKRRPSYQDLPVVQSCQPILDGAIPSIPDNVRAKFVRRLSASPGMECLTQTYLSNEHINMEDASESLAGVSFDFFPPSSSPPPPPEHQSRAQSELPPTPPLRKPRRSLSFFRSKQASEKKQDTDLGSDRLLPNVIHLGTVASALGRSPYDIAMPSIPKKKNGPMRTHPHQLGNAMPRAKSMLSMDAETAAELARLRSRDRTLPRPEMPRRPKSYHEMNLEAGEATAARRRPRSVYADAPPMPSIDRASRSFSRDASPQVQAELGPVEPKSKANIRARSTGRGQVVSQMVGKYDQSGQRVAESGQLDWEAHARLWSQRRKSIGEGLHKRAEAASTNPSRRSQRASTEPLEGIYCDRYIGGLDYGYERGYGIGGSAGTRQTHCAASRKSLHFSNQYGVDLSDVPVIVHRG